MCELFPSSSSSSSSLQSIKNDHFLEWTDRLTALRCAVLCNAAAMTLLYTRRRRRRRRTVTSRDKKRSGPPSSSFLLWSIFTRPQNKVNSAQRSASLRRTLYCVRQQQQQQPFLLGPNGSREEEYNTLSLLYSTLLCSGMRRRVVTNCRSGGRWFFSDEPLPS